MIFSDTVFNENNNVFYYFHKDPLRLTKKTMTPVGAHIQEWDPVAQRTIEEYDVDEWGCIHGLFLQYYPSGNLRKRVRFQHGHVDSFYAWWDNGLPKKVCHESEENPDIQHYSEWWENGVQSRYLQFWNEEIDGFVNEWWDDGGLRSMSTYKDGVKEGLAIEAEKDGSAKIRFYQDGVSVC
jgi:antitoxin component YwqK of YwqJK toxin-antitoxin module